MNVFLSDLFSNPFFNRFFMDFGGALEAKTMDSVWDG